MKKTETEENKPISPIGYIGYSILFAIPLVGFISTLIFSFGGTKNINVKNYAKAYLYITIFAFVVTLVVSIAFPNIMKDIWASK